MISQELGLQSWSIPRKKPCQDFEIDNKAQFKFLISRILTLISRILTLLFFSLLFHPLPSLLVQRESRLESRSKQESQEVSRIPNLDEILWGFVVVLFSSSRPTSGGWPETACLHSSLYEGYLPQSPVQSSYHNNAVYTRAAGLEKVSLYSAVRLNVLLPSSPETKTNGTNPHITSYNPLSASGPRLHKTITWGDLLKG